MLMSKDSRIYVAGHNGLVGSAIWRELEHQGFKNLIGRRQQFSIWLSKRRGSC